MSNYSKTLLLMASRLGLSEKEKVLSKAAEFERRLQMKLTNNKTISDMVKVAICLDLATMCCGEEYDMKAAIRFLSTKQNVYNSNKLFIENLLDMKSQRLTAAALCVSLQCTTVQELAEEILEKYRDIKGIINLDLPQYVCMAVYQACRLQKLKVSKSKLIEKSRLKPGQFTKLEAEWTKFVNEHFTPVPKSIVPRTCDEIVENKMEVDTPQKKLKESDSQMEVYFKWKKRILDNAYKEIALAKKQGLLIDSKKDEKKKSGAGSSKHTEKTKHSGHEEEKQIKDFEFSLIAPLRRSPRKSPQKLPSEIYKSPPSLKGIKLVFPNN